MVSRGISQVSAMILAMVSKVEDIGNSLICKDLWRPRRIPRPAPSGHPDQASRPREIGARIAKRGRKFNAGKYLRPKRQRVTGSFEPLPAVMPDIDRRAASPAG